MVGGKLDLADLNAETAHSGQNSDNAVRQAIKQLIRPNNYGTTLAEKNGFSPDEIAQIKHCRSWKYGRKHIAVRRQSSGGGGGLGSLVSAAEGMHVAGPFGAAAPLVGYALKKSGNAITGNAANTLDTMVRSRSPLAQSIAASQPKAISTGQTNPLAQILAQKFISQTPGLLPTAAPTPVQ